MELRLFLARNWGGTHKDPYNLSRYILGVLCLSATHKVTNSIAAFFVQLFQLLLL